MTWIKICGTTDLKDALVAVEAGADAVGFVFYAKSPRNISVDAAREIVAKLPESVAKVGVFVGATAEAVAKISKETVLTAAQIYANPHSQCSTLDDEFVEKVPCRIIAALSIGLIAENELAGFHVSHGVRDRIMAILLDSGGSGRPGGTGKTFDWESAASFSELMNQGSLKLIVAGGLTENNVGKAIEILRPWGVDVASGVEIRPGKKDPEKVRAFVRAVREMDRKVS